MPRKTHLHHPEQVRIDPASMRPRPDAAENRVDWVQFDAAVGGLQ